MKTGLPRHTPTETLITVSKDLSVQQLTALSTLPSMQKVLHTEKPKYLSDKLKQNNTITRQENTIRYDSQLTLTRGAYFYRAAGLFSSLPPELRVRMEPSSFKPKPKAWVRSHIPIKPL